MSMQRLYFYIDSDFDIDIGKVSKSTFLWKSIICIFQWAVSLQKLQKIYSFDIEKAPKKIMKVWYLRMNLSMKSAMVTT